MKYKKGTFAIIPNIQLLHELPCEAQVIFMHLCFFSDENGTCYPSRQTLADRSNLNIKTIDKYLSLLIDKGIIKKKQRRLKSKEYTSHFIFKKNHGKIVINKKIIGVKKIFFLFLKKFLFPAIKSSFRSKKSLSRYPNTQNPIVEQ
jgi:DNA-binding transcriptional MocR family regulator